MTSSLFPETAPIQFTANHFRFISLLLSHSEGILQKKVVALLKIDKTTVSELKQDFLRLGWCKEVDLGSGKEVCLKVSRRYEVDVFLSGWLSARKTIPVRPHSILVKGSFEEKGSRFLYALHKLSQKYPVKIYPINNNRKYTFETEYGSFTLMLKGNGITYWVDGFVLPIAKEDVHCLEEYVEKGICERVNAMHTIVKEHFGKSKITVSDVIILKELHMGILTKENVAVALNIFHSLKRTGLFKDASIDGLDEWEAAGQFGSVINRIKSALQTFFEKQAEQEEGEKEGNNEKSEVEQNAKAK